MRSLKKCLLVLGISAAISACGSSSNPPTAEIEPITAEIEPIQATIAGTAAKGIIIGGLVNAFELDSTGTELRTVGSTTTNGKGLYSLSLNDTYTGGPIKIQITNNDETTMVCDVPVGCGTRTDGIEDTVDPSNVAFGEHYKPASLSMTALVPDAENGETLVVQITPFTHMAAKNALNNPTLDATAIQTANALVSNLLGGFDILRTAPIDITDSASVAGASPTAILYASLSASIASLAPKDANGQPDINAAIETLAAEFIDGSMDAQDGDNDNGKISLGEIVTAASAVNIKAEIVDNSGVLTALETKVQTAGTVTITPVAPDPSTLGDTNVALARAFITDLRTWGAVIMNETEAPSEAFSDQLDLAMTTSDMVDDINGVAIAAAIDVVANLYNDDNNSLAKTGYETSSGVFFSGTFTKTTADGHDVYTTTGASVTEDGQMATVDLSVIVPKNGESISTLELGIRSAKAESDFSIFEVKSGVATLTFPDGQNWTVDTSDNLVDPTGIDKMTLDLAVAITNKQVKTSDTVDTLIDAADPVTFEGGFSITIYPYTALNDDGELQIPGATLGAATLNGSLSNTTGGSLNVNFTAMVPNAAKLTPVNPLLVLGSTYADNNNREKLIHWEYTNSGNTFSYTGPYETFTATFNETGSSISTNRTYSYDDGTGTAAYVDIILDYASLSDYLVSTGYYFGISGQAFIHGQGEYERDINSFSPVYTRDGSVEFTLVEQDVEFDYAAEVIDVGLQFDIQLANLPKANISVTGKQSALDTGTASISLSYGVRNLTFTAATELSDGSNVDSGNLEITNLDGVKLTINGNLFLDDNEGNSTGDVTINGKVIATLKEMDNGAAKVSYIDGTFEIF
jgi:hypothetical protein